MLNESFKDFVYSQDVLASANHQRVNSVLSAQYPLSINVFTHTHKQSSEVVEGILYKPLMVIMMQRDALLSVGIIAHKPGIASTNNHYFYSPLYL